MEQVIELPLDQVVAALQVRTEFSDESLHGLMQTLVSTGQQEPIKVRPEDGLFVVVDGERRLRAAKRAGWTTIKAIVVEGDLTPAAIRQRQLVTNCQRDSLTPMETATAITELMEETRWAATEVASQLGMSNATISRLLALVKLPEPIQERVRTGEIPASSAYELGKVENVADMNALAAQIVGGKLSRDALSEIVRKGNAGGEAAAQPTTRLKVELSEGRSITMTLVGLSTVDVLIESLRELIAKAKKCPKDLQLSGFAKVMRDEAKRNRYA